MRLHQGSICRTVSAAVVGGRLLLLQPSQALGAAFASGLVPRAAHLAICAALGWMRWQEPT